MKITFPTDPILMLSAGVRDRVHVNLRYESSDPYAAAIIIAYAGRIATFLCGRDLLHDGLTRMVGEGRFRVTPGADTIAVAICDGLLLFARDDLTEFLRTTYLTVPAGTENRHLDWSDVDALLAGGAA